jgi:hypothetical protein
MLRMLYNLIHYKLSNEETIMTLKQADHIARQFGLVRGRGTYNGAAFWVRPGHPAIITLARLVEIVAGG